MASLGQETLTLITSDAPASCIVYPPVENRSKNVRGGSRKKRRRTGWSSQKGARTRASGPKSAKKGNSGTVSSSKNEFQESPYLKPVIVGTLMGSEGMTSTDGLVQGVQIQLNDEFESLEIEIDLSAPDSNSDTPDVNSNCKKEEDERDVSNYSKNKCGVQDHRVVGKTDKNSRHTDRDVRFLNRKMNECANLVSTINSDIAKGYLASVCRKLQNAVSMLCDFNEEIDFHDVGLELFVQRCLKTVSETFDTIQAAYGSVMEQRNESSDAFLRLLELARSCQKLLSSKQVQEVEDMIQCIKGHANGGGCLPDQSRPTSSEIIENDVGDVDSKVSLAHSGDVEMEDHIIHKMGGSLDHHVSNAQSVTVHRNVEGFDVRDLVVNGTMEVPVSFDVRQADVEMKDPIPEKLLESGAELLAGVLDDSVQESPPVQTMEEDSIKALHCKEEDVVHSSIREEANLVEKNNQVISSPLSLLNSTFMEQTDLCKLSEAACLSEIVEDDLKMLKIDGAENPQCQAQSTESSVTTIECKDDEKGSSRNVKDIKQELKVRDPRKVLRDAQPPVSSSKLECGNNNEDLGSSVSQGIVFVEAKHQQDMSAKKECSVKAKFKEFSQDETTSQLNMDGVSETCFLRHHKAQHKDLVADIPMLKMKARDPRRALLESAQLMTKSDNGGTIHVGHHCTETNKRTQAEKSIIKSVTPCVPLLAKSNSMSEEDASQNRVTHGPTLHSNPKNDRHYTFDPRLTSLGPPVLQKGKNIANNFYKPSVKKNRDAITRPLEALKHWGDLDLFEGTDERERGAIFQERARRLDEQKRMLNSRKLCLVLDLDHTLLNSAKFAELGPDWDAVLLGMGAAERNKVAKDGLCGRELYRFSHMGMWTKLRPGVWNFLSRASKLYELHVYTMGNKAYATEMAKLLDPTGSLFAGRVISKGDDSDAIPDERLCKSKDLDGVLGMESAVIIIDDSLRVWPHHRQNLVIVERYMYFPSSRKQFGLSGPSLLEKRHDEREVDGMLACVLQVIEKVHQNFFSNKQFHEVDVRHVLAGVKQNVLAGCKIVFSRVFPQGDRQAHLHPLWQTAEHFGAICTTAMNESVTHVVGISCGTDKVKWAMSTGRYCVCPQWLEASATLYRRVNELDFPIPS